MKKVNLILTLLLFAVVLSQAQPLEEKQRVFGSDVEAGDMFGNAVCISGDYAFIGSFLDGDNGEVAGAVYVYYNNNGIWEEQQKLIGSDSEYYDSFGSSVSISGDYAIIGAAWADNEVEDAGAAYIFYNNAGIWEEYAILTAPDFSLNACFGFSVSINGNYVIIGADQDGDGTIENSPGAAYIFYNNEGNWEFQTKLTASDGITLDHYGSSVDIHGDYAVVGSGYSDISTFDEGAAYVYYNNSGTWEEQAKLTAEDYNTNDEFGKSVAIHGDFIIVGMYGDDDLGNFSGSAYIFKNNSGTWEQHSKIYAEDGSAVSNFGWSVDIYENYAIVGAWGDNDIDYDNGAVYIFTYEDDTWSQETKILPSDAGFKSSMGYCVSIYGENAVSGAPNNETAGVDAGTAYFLGPIETNINTLNENNISIYPNPTSSTISLQTLETVHSVSITDITGKIVFTQLKIQINEIIDISQLKNGIYFIKIKTDKEIITNKIIKI